MQRKLVMNAVSLVVAPRIGLVPNKPKPITHANVENGIRPTYTTSIYPRVYSPARNGFTAPALARQDNETGGLLPRIPVLSGLPFRCISATKSPPPFLLVSRSARDREIHKRKKGSKKARYEEKPATQIYTNVQCAKRGTVKPCCSRYVRMTGEFERRNPRDRCPNLSPASRFFLPFSTFRICPMAYSASPRVHRRIR